MSLLKKYDSPKIKKSLIDIAKRFANKGENWAKPKVYKIVYSFDINGNFIKKYDSIKDVLEYLGISESKIRYKIQTEKDLNGVYYSYNMNLYL